MHRLGVAKASGPLQQQIVVQCKLAKMLLPVSNALPVMKVSSGPGIYAHRKQAQTQWKQQVQQQDQERSQFHKVWSSETGQQQMTQTVRSTAQSFPQGTATAYAARAACTQSRSS